MSNGFLSKIGRALSIFGVSNPDDVRKMEARKTRPSGEKPAPAAAPQSGAVDSPSQEKRTEDE
jgi:hypothetical protein